MSVFGNINYEDSVIMVNVYILTRVGVRKVQQKFYPYNLTEIGEKADLHRTTVAKIIDGNEGVSLKSIERFSDNLDLGLEENIDYQPFQNQTNHGTKKTNHSQNYEVPKYVERPLIEQQVYESMLLTGCILRIKAPKKMGKTILITRVLQQLKSKSKLPDCIY